MTDTKQEKDAGVERAPDRLNIQGTKTPIFYVALAEKILTDQETLHIHALGSCIEAAVGVADRLERNGLATVAKIRTDRSGRREGTAQIVISVARAKNFNELFEKQKEERNSRSAAYEERKAKQQAEAK
eukprot:Rhum_TRINITY_DN13041_c0_g1::Rhum_TRINITY_DN13041_c0_g1_i4::g.56319::m.56319